LVVLDIQGAEVRGYGGYEWDGRSWSCASTEPQEACLQNPSGKGAGLATHAMACGPHNGHRWNKASWSCDGRCANAQNVWADCLGENVKMKENDFMACPEGFHIASTNSNENGIISGNQYDREYPCHTDKLDCISYARRCVKSTHYDPEEWIFKTEVLKKGGTSASDEELQEDFGPLATQIQATYEEWQTDRMAAPDVCLVMPWKSSPACTPATNQLGMGMGQQGHGNGNGNGQSTPAPAPTPTPASTPTPAPTHTPQASEEDFADWTPPAGMMPCSNACWKPLLDFMEKAVAASAVVSADVKQFKAASADAELERALGIKAGTLAIGSGGQPDTHPCIGAKPDPCVSFRAIFFNRIEVTSCIGTKIVGTDRTLILPKMYETKNKSDKSVPLVWGVVGMNLAKALNTLGGSSPSEACAENVKSLIAVLRKGVAAARFDHAKRLMAGATDTITEEISFK